MIGLYTAEEIRAAEEPLLAATPPGTLMQRAATGLATVCARLLHGVYGRRVTLLVGTGNNGGDALYAGARLAQLRCADALPTASAVAIASGVRGQCEPAAQPGGAGPSGGLHRRAISRRPVPAPVG